MSSVIQPNEPDILRDHTRRLVGLESVIGRWVFVLPLAPALPPPGFNVNDPLSPPFLNGWLNGAAGEQATCFRIHPATKIQIRSGGLAGGTIPSVVFNLPVNFRPTQGAIPVQFPSVTGTSIFTGRIDPNGDVWILDEIAKPAIGTIAAEYKTGFGLETVIPDGGSGVLTWDDLLAGDDLFDRTDPAAPIALVKGIYSFIVDVDISALTAGGWAGAQFSVGWTPLPGKSDKVYLSGGQLDGFDSLVAVWPLNAGDPITLTIGNHDGASTRSFAIVAAYAALIS